MRENSIAESGMTAEELEGLGYIRISDAARKIDINLGWLRTKVRKGALVEGEHFVRSDKNWIYFTPEAVEEMASAQADRAERKLLRAEGKLPKAKGKYYYTPAKVSGLKNFRSWVRASDYDDETKEIVDMVIQEALAEFIDEWQARKAKNAAEAETEAAE